MAAAKEELAAALRAVAAQSREGKDSSCELSRCGMCELITGQMTMMALPGTA